MENAWLKEKIREELEKEYIQKLDELREIYENRMEEGFEDAWKIIQNQKTKHEQDLKQAKLDMIDAVDRFLQSSLGKKDIGMTSKEIVDLAIHGLNLKFEKIEEASLS